MSQIAHVACPHDCPDSCLMDVTVTQGKAVKVTANKAHPFTRGALCAKVNKFLERVYASDRLLYPVKRIGPKGPGAQFERISWDEAIAAVADKMREALAAHGPQAILPYSYRGNNGVYQSNGIDRRFFHALGASTRARTICAGGVYDARTLEMHPHDAALRGLSEGEDVRVFNARGSFIIPLKISSNVPPGTVATFWGWWDKLSGDQGTVNNVTSAKLTDLGGGGTFYDCRVEVERAVV